jgi:2-C-methyl-D-erythritol 2,4-cyclodiphosphate synthase
VNVDAVVIAEAPRLGPVRDAICVNIAQALRLGAGQVSVKATPHETLGAVGRGEGIAAMATVLVEVAGA